MVPSSFGLGSVVLPMMAMFAPAAKQERIAMALPIPRVPRLLWAVPTVLFSKAPHVGLYVS